MSARPNIELRQRLRAAKGRDPFPTYAQRFDPHADRSRHGWQRCKYDPRGFDPLEDMRTWRGPCHPSLPPSFAAHRAKAYAEARRVAMKPVTLPKITAAESYIERMRRVDPVVAQVFGPVFAAMFPTRSAA